MTCFMKVERRRARGGGAEAASRLGRATSGLHVRSGRTCERSAAASAKGMDTRPLRIRRLPGCSSSPPEPSSSLTSMPMAWRPRDQRARTLSTRRTRHAPIRACPAPLQPARPRPRPRPPKHAPTCALLRCQDFSARPLRSRRSSSSSRSASRTRARAWRASGRAAVLFLWVIQYPRVLSILFHGGRAGERAHTLSPHARGPAESGVAQAGALRHTACTGARASAAAQAHAGRVRGAGRLMQLGGAGARAGRRRRAARRVTCGRRLWSTGNSGGGRSRCSAFTRPAQRCASRGVTSASARPSAPLWPRPVRPQLRVARRRGTAAARVASRALAWAVLRVTYVPCCERCGRASTRSAERGKPRREWCGPTRLHSRPAASGLGTRAGTCHVARGTWHVLARVRCAPSATWQPCGSPVDVGVGAGRQLVVDHGRHLGH
jgi:hypothetical protein